jgi:hypothetical protein
MTIWDELEKVSAAPLQPCKILMHPDNFLDLLEEQKGFIGPVETEVAYLERMVKRFPDSGYWRLSLVGAKMREEYLKKEETNA